MKAAFFAALEGLFWWDQSKQGFSSSWVFDLIVMLNKPVLVVSGDRTKNFQDSGVDCSLTLLPENWRSLSLLSRFSCIS